MKFLTALALVLSYLIAPPTVQAAPGHRVLLQGNGRLAVIEPEGAISWQMPWGGIHDLQVLVNGHLLTIQGPSRVVEINPVTKQIVWHYDSATANGNDGLKVEVHAAVRRPTGETIIAESGRGRIIEVNRAGELVSETPLIRNHPSAHSDTRLVRPLENGTYLIAHEADGMVREIDRSGAIVWQYEVPLFGNESAPGHGPEAFGNRLFSATRLANGNTLIGAGNGHSVLEVTPNHEIVNKVAQDDLPSIRLAWVTTVQVLSNGNWVIGNCHAGPGQPLLIEIEPSTHRVVWTLDRYDDFGNSVSNALVIDDQPWHPVATAK